MAMLKKKKEQSDSASAKRNWYEDRYQTVVVQRNFLVLLSFISLAGIILSVLGVVHVSSTKSIEPFVIEIEEKTGVTNVIRPLLKEQFASDEVLRRYFIRKYLNARETFTPTMFDHNVEVVRLMSTYAVLLQFKKYMDNDPRSPKKMGFIRTYKVNSFTQLGEGSTEKGYTYQVRIVTTDVNEKASTVDPVVTPLVVTIDFTYVDIRENEEQRAINPLGFQVSRYVVEQETLK